MVKIHKQCWLESVAVIKIDKPEMLAALHKIKPLPLQVNFAAHKSVATHIHTRTTVEYQI